MLKKEIYNEIEQTFGLVPSMFKTIPDSSLELEWKLFKQVQLEEGPIPNKYRELIGVAVSAISKCHIVAIDNPCPYSIDDYGQHSQIVALYL